MSDNGHAGRECGQSVHVISVTVGENHGGDRFGRDFGDILEQLLAGRGRCLGVDDNHSLFADDDTTITAAALHPVHIWLQLVDCEWRRRLSLALRRCPQNKRQTHER